MMLTVYPTQEADDGPADHETGVEDEMMVAPSFVTVSQVLELNCTVL